METDREKLARYRKLVRGADRLIKDIQCALGTNETGSRLVEVARKARQDQRLYNDYRLTLREYQE